MLSKAKLFLFFATLVFGATPLLPLNAEAQTSGRKPVTVRVIDRTDDLAMGMHRVRYDRSRLTIKDAGSVVDAIQKIRHRLRKDECIDVLVFHGHGSPGRLSIGAGITGKTFDGRVPNGAQVIDGKSLPKPHQTERLAELADLLCDDAESNGQVDIVLRGCCVGATEEASGRDGSAKLHKIAKMFPKGTVCVRGSTGPLRTDLHWSKERQTWYWVDKWANGSKWVVAYNTDPSPPPAEDRIFSINNTMVPIHPIPEPPDRDYTDPKQNKRLDDLFKRHGNNGDNH